MVRQPLELWGLPCGYAVRRVGGMPYATGPDVAGANIQGSPRFGRARFVSVQKGLTSYDGIGAHLVLLLQEDVL